MSAMAASASRPMPGMPSVSFRVPVLPWTIAADDERRFRRITQTVLLLAALVFIAMPWLPVHVADPARPTELPAPMARLLIEQALVSPPPMAAKALPKPVAKAIEREATNKRPEPPRPALDRRQSAPARVALNKEAPVPEARVPVPDKPPGEIDAARRKAAGIGLLAMTNDLQELHGAPIAVQMRDIRQGPGVGTSTGVGVGGGNEAGVPTRALITSNATGGSGGINTASYSKNTGGGGLAGRSTTMVEGAIGGGGGGGAGGGGARGRGDGTGSGIGGSGGHGSGSGPGGGGNSAIARSGSGKASRSIEDVKLVFERNKGSIYAIYNRMLREEPSLQGKVVLKLTISPSGAAECQIVSSELKTPELESKLLARVRQFDFGAKDVEVLIINWPVDFLPA